MIGTSGQRENAGRNRPPPTSLLCATMNTKRPQRQLVLNKGAEKYIFRYEQGREDELLDALVEQAKDRRTDFDWFDAAVISFKLTQGLIGCAEQLLQNDSDARAMS